MKKMISNANYDRTCIGYALKESANNKCEVNAFGGTYTVKCDITVAAGKKVRVKKPQNNINEMYIESICKT